MRLSVNLSIGYWDQAEALKKLFYPAIPAAKVRTSYVFQTCIENFEEKDHGKLQGYLRDASLPDEYAPRQINIKQAAGEKLKRLAAALSANISATLRAVILYWLDHQAESESAQPHDEGLLSMILALDQEIDNLHARIAAIRKLVENSQNNQPTAKEDL